VHDVNFKSHDRSLRNWNACRLMSRKISKQLFNGMNYTHHVWFLRLLISENDDNYSSWC
jgi:hypothetical protein